MRRLDAFHLCDELYAERPPDADGDYRQANHRPDPAFQGRTRVGHIQTCAPSLAKGRQIEIRAIVAHVAILGTPFLKAHPIWLMTKFLSTVGCGIESLAAGFAPMDRRHPQLHWFHAIPKLLNDTRLLDFHDSSTTAIGNARFRNLIIGNRIIARDVYGSDDSRYVQKP